MDSHSDDSSDDSSGSFDDGSSSEASFNDAEDQSNRLFQYPPDTDTTKVEGSGRDGWLRNLTNEEWEELGRNITNHSRVEIRLYDGALNDHKMAFFCRGLTRSSSIIELDLFENGLSAAAVRSMVPFLQNATNLKELHLDNNNIQTEGFNIMFRAFRDSPIETLLCNDCGIESIEIENDYFPKHLVHLGLLW